jgi:hypothetical protein
VAKGGTWTTVAMDLTDLFSKPINIADAYGMTRTQAERALTWAQKHGYPGARIVPRSNGLYGVALN